MYTCYKPITSMCHTSIQKKYLLFEHKITVNTNIINKYWIPVLLGIPCPMEYLSYIKRMHKTCVTLIPSRTINHSTQIPLNFIKWSKNICIIYRTHMYYCGLLLCYSITNFFLFNNNKYSDFFCFLYLFTN